MTSIWDNKEIFPPTRAEKRFVTLPVNISSLAFEGREGSGDGYRASTVTHPLGGEDFIQTRVKDSMAYAAGFTQYMGVRLQGRGERGEDLTYTFLVNPDTLTASRQTLDGEALTRAGLQTGIWGDTLDITISGATTGQYFAGTLVDGHSEYSLSERSFQNLVSIYENNGSWFEGEGEADMARKQLSSHGDVTLFFGNFIWSGCFTDLTIDDTADTPYYNKFSIGFMAWRERFRSDSPWRNSIRVDDYYGHAYEIYSRKKVAAVTPKASTSNATSVITGETDASKVPAYQRKML